jgi:FixJ family two-component response regulator
VSAEFRKHEEEGQLEHPKNSERNEILVLDTNSCECEKLRTVLENAGYKLVCVADEVALLESAHLTNTACIVLDVTLRGAAGLSILEDLRKFGAPVIVTSENGDIPTAVKAIRAGAHDFIRKPFCPEKIIDQLEEFRSSLANPVSKAPTATSLPFNFPGKPLTRREQDVIVELASGLSSREIALAFGISHRTVEDHRANLMRKMGVRNAAELMIAILNSGFKPRRRRGRISRLSKRDNA